MISIQSLNLIPVCWGWREDICYCSRASKSVLELYTLSERKTLPHKFSCFALILSQHCNALLVKDLKWRIVKLNCPTRDYCTFTETGFSLDCNNIRVSPYFQCLARTGIYRTSSRKYCKYLSLHEAIPFSLTGRWGWHHTVAKLWWVEFKD